MNNNLGRVPLRTIDEDAEAMASTQATPPGGKTAPETASFGAAQMPSQEDLEKTIIAQLRTCYDPEIPIDIYELGLVYGIDIDPERAVTIRMTLTSPACPVA